MAEFSKVFATAEMTGGEFLTERITLADQLQYERSARANGWHKDDQGQANAFLAWHALKRAGKVTCSWEEFGAAAVDLDITRETVDTDGEDDAPGGFTR